MNKLTAVTTHPLGKSRHSARVIASSLVILGSLLMAPSARALDAVVPVDSETLNSIQSGGSNHAQRSPDARPSRGGSTGPQQASPEASRPNGHYGPHSGYGLPNYSWGRGGVSRLRSYFREDLRQVNRWHRRPLFVGAYFPHRHRMYIQPVPRGLMRYLPPVPRGYAMGYFDGYCLVFDPRTLLIVSVVDLYRY